MIKIQIFTISFLVGLFSAMSANAENNPAILDSWINLSASSQNASVLMAQSKPGEAIDPGMGESLILEISQSLDKLVELKFLIRKVFSFKQSDILNQNDSKINEFIFSKSEKYGYFTMKEMLNLGLSHQYMVYRPNELVVLNVYLPREEMKAFEEYTKDFRVK